MPITDISRDWGVSPSIVRIITTDTLAAIQTAGYFATQTAVVNDINKGIWEWAPSDVAAIKCSDGQGFFIYDSTTSSFVVDVPIGNDFATRELDNLQNTAVNSAIIPDVDNTQDLGSVNIGWANLYAYSVQMTAIDGFTLNISAYDTLGDAYTPFILLTAGNPPTCQLLDGVTAVTQLPGNDSDLVATTAYVDDSFATNILNNLGVTEINASLIPGANNGIDLGTAVDSWRDLYGYHVRTNSTAAQALTVDAYDTLGAAYTTFITLTAGNPPTCALSSAVTGVTQALADNSLKLATTAYVDTSITAITTGLITVRVPVTAAQFKAIYTTPLLVIADPLGKYIRIESFILHMLGGGSVGYAVGGAILLQYGNAAHGAGTAASATIAAATVNGWVTTESLVLANGALGNNPFANVAATGIFLSCQTADFTTGNANFILDISYSVFSAT